MQNLHNSVLAAVDIGSNAVRFQISKVLVSKGVPSLKRIEFLRFPLRFGKEVFGSYEIGAKKEKKFIKLMKAFKLLMELYEVNHTMVCATSAMREAKNGEKIVQKVLKETGLQIQVISGDLEAELLNLAIQDWASFDTYVHVDVGGGSTEINIFENGSLKTARSFNMGSVRSLLHPPTSSDWKEFAEWIRSNLPGKHEPLVVGTGGNINKILDLAQEMKGGDGKGISERLFRELLLELQALSLDERIQKFRLNDDRADVILPASEIYLEALKASGSHEIVVPKVGLRDGILLYLLKKHLNDTPKYPF